MHKRYWQASYVLRLVPGPPHEIDTESFAGSDARSNTSRPWLFMNMIMSSAGGFSIDGVSRPLGNSVDKSLLLALRQNADILLVGRKTAEAESYSRPESGPRLALVTSSPQSLVDTALFEPSRGPDDRLPIVVTSSNEPGLVGTDSVGTSFDVTGNQSEPISPFVPLRSLTSLSDPTPAILSAGYSDDSESNSASAANKDSKGKGVDLAFALDELGRMGAKTVLCEGGPTLSAQLLAHDLVDEINLTVSPVIASPIIASAIPANSATSASSMASPAIQPPNLALRAFRLAQLATEDDYLYMRYVRP